MLLLIPRMRITMFHSVKLIREQKEEYMDHLFDVLYESTYKLFKMMYLSVMNEKEVLKSFQKEIARIPEWNKLKVEAAYKDFLSTSKCTYFPDLLKTIYILSIKMVLLGIPSEKRNKIKIKVPDPETFCHRLWIHIARDVWKRPYLFYHQVKSIEQQNHLYQFETIIRRKIRSVIRDTIPMELMVQQLSNSDILAEEDKGSDSSDETSEAVGSDDSEAVGSETSEAEDKDDSLSDDDESETEEEGSEVSETIGTVDKDSSLSEDDKSSTDGEESELSDAKESDEFKEEETVGEGSETSETVGVDKDESSSEDGPEEVGVDSEVSDTEDKELETSEAVVGEDKDESLSNDISSTIDKDLSLLSKEGLETYEPIELETPKVNEEEIPLIQDTPVTIYEEPKKKLIHIQELMKHKKKHRSKDRFF